MSATGWRTTAAGMKPGATRCPECDARREERAFRDPISGREHVAVVHHAPGCRIYRQRDYDRSEGVAHLQALTTTFEPAISPA